MMKSIWIAACLGLATLTSACGSSPSNAASSSFHPGGCGLTYSWLPSDQVGAVVRSSEVTNEAQTAKSINALLALAGYAELSPVAYGMRLFKLRYTTQNRGKSVQATGLVAVPSNAGAPAFQAPTLLELHPTTGFYGPCAPSAPANLHSTALGLAVLASQGYIVVAPDYIGMDADAPASATPDPMHAYLESEQVAVGSLDMLRAADKLLAEKSGIEAHPDGDVLLWGASQGGHAAFATDLYAPYYAPEFHIIGAVAAIPPTDLTGLAEHGLTTFGSTSEALAAAMVSLDNYYSDGSHVPEILTNTAPQHFATALLSDMTSSCSDTSIFANVTDTSQLFQKTAIDAASKGEFSTLDPWGCYASHNSFATTPVKRRSNTPFLFILGEKDDLVIPSIERADFQRLCQMGYRMQFLECSGAGHVQAGTWSIPEQVSWLAARVKGEPMTNVCQLAPPTHCSAQQ